MSQPIASQTAAILGHFRLAGRVISATPYGNGHINDTFLVVTEKDGQETRYVLQRLNPVAFREPEKVMENVSRVTAFLQEGVKQRGGDPTKETLTLVPTTDNLWHVLDNEGNCWRMYLNIDDTISWQLPDSVEVFMEAGRAFGAFQTALCAYPADTLHETIPHFHDTPGRIETLKQSVAADVVHRAKDAAAEIAFALARAQQADRLLQQYREGKLPLRVTHNDTKLNNVLMNAATGKAQCVIDLDTVMPGLSAYDFGDAIRFGANTADEDEQDVSKIHFSMPMFRAYCEGYLSEAGESLTREEIASLPLGAWMMTYECGSRFLTDYLDGDVYFHTAYPEHNLIRARNQFTLLADMERYMDEMNDTVMQWMKE